MNEGWSVKNKNETNFKVLKQPGCTNCKETYFVVQNIFCRQIHFHLTAGLGCVSYSVYKSNSPFKIVSKQKLDIIIIITTPVSYYTYTYPHSRRRCDNRTRGVDLLSG